MFIYVDALCLLPLTMYPKTHTHTHTHTHTYIMKITSINTHGLTGQGAPPWSSGSELDHKSLAPLFESRGGHI